MPGRKRGFGYEWDPWEDDILVACRGNISWAWLARRLGRTYWAVHGRRRKMGITADGKHAPKPHDIKANHPRFWRIWRRVIAENLPEWRKRLSSGQFEDVLALEWRPRIEVSGGCRRCRYKRKCREDPLGPLCETVTVGDALAATIDRNDGGLLS